MEGTTYTDRFRRDIVNLMESSQNDTSVCPIKVKPIGDSLNELMATITGPPGTPYEGGRFEVRVSVPPGYPFEAPQFKFVTKVWHPNIASSTGQVCLGISERWDSCMTIHSSLLNIQVLLSSPEPRNNPLEAAAALQIHDCPKIFKKTAQHWTALYARGPKRNPEYDGCVQTMIELGIEPDDAVSALAANNWNVEQASSVYFDFFNQQQ